MNEDELTKELEVYEKRRQEEYDEATKGNEEIRKKREGDQQLDIPGLFEARSGARIGAGLAFEVGANSFLDALTLVPGSQQVGSALINAIAQGIRGGKFSFGELLASAAASQIPGLSQAKAVTKAGRLARATGQGAVSGAIEATSIAAVDEGRLPTAQEFGLGVGAGGIFGAGFDIAGDKLVDPRVTGMFRDLKARINNPQSSFELAGTVGAAKARPPNFSTTGTFGRARYYESPQQTQRIANELVNTWGMKDFIFDYDQYQLMRPKVLKSKSRLFGELFESVPYTKVRFKTIQQAKIPRLQEQYSSIVTALGFPKEKFQLHHVVPIKGSLPGYDGLAFGSDEWWDVTEILFRNMLRPGDDIFNLQALVGGNKPTTIIQNGIPTKFPTPHSVTHKFLDAKIGPSGELFWTKEVRDKMKLDFEYRKEKWQEYSEIVKKSQDVTNQAEFTFKDLYENVPREQLDDELDLLVERLVDLDDNGLLNATKVDDNYQVPQMADIVKEVKEGLLDNEAEANLRAIIGRDGLLAQFVRNREIIESDLRLLSQMSLPEQLAAIQRSTGLTASDIDLLIQTQPGFDIVKFIRDNQ